MKNKNNIAAFTGAVAFSMIFAVSGVQAETERSTGTTTKAESRGLLNSATADSKVEIQETARQAASVYRKFTAGAKSQIPQAEIEKAKCIAVFPNLTNVAVVIGGRHGDGVVSCRTATGFSNAAPLDLTSASIGVQLGANQTDLILLFQSDKARQRLEKGLLTLGADASVTAWTEDRKSMGKAVTTEPTDVLAFAEDKGLFAGAALSGTQLKIDSDEVRNLYGKEIGNTGILTNRVEENLVGPVKEFVDAIAK